MQARYLTCHVDAHHLPLKLGENNLSSKLPNIHDALMNLKTIDIIGITEFYPTFICLFMYKAFSYMPLKCNCNSIQDSNATMLNTTKITTLATHYETHGLPRHSWMNLSYDTIRKIDALTTLDKKVYMVSITRFIEDVKGVENLTNYSILCRDMVQKALNTSLSYLNLEILNSYVSNR